MSVFGEKYIYNVLRYLGVMAVNTSELATIFKTNLTQVASNKNHIITFVLCMPHCLLMVKLNKCI